MSTADYTVVRAIPTGHLRLHVAFRDGLEGDVIVRPTALRGVFTPLNDPAFFAQVSYAGGFVTWPGEIDLAPDTMHDDIRAAGVCVVE